LRNASLKRSDFILGRPAPGDQAHAVAVALQPEAVAVIFHLVEPITAGGNSGRSGGDAKIKHAAKINVSAA
jgi:hypothetical protein